MRQISLADWKPTRGQIRLVNKVLKSGRLTYGPMTEELEIAFANAHDRKYALFMNSGTSALQIAIHFLKEELGWKPDNEIIVPAVTFVATANAVLLNNLKVRFVDVDPVYFDLDTKKLEKAITKKTVAIIPVHLLGQVCEMDRIMNIAQRYNLKVIEDSCETMFVKYKGKPAGSWGDIACFSSYLAHIMSTGVGGFLCTNNKRWAEAMSSMRWHGRDNLYLKIDDDDNLDSDKKLKAVIKARFRFNRLGYSFRATEFEAALGLDEISRYKQIVGKRQMLGEYLKDNLLKRHLDIFLQLPHTRHGGEHCYMFFPLVCGALVNRDDLVFYLEKHGIQTRYIMPLINQPVYKDLKIDPGEFPVASWINDKGFAIGCHQFLTKGDMDYVGKVLSEYFADQLIEIAKPRA